MLSLSDLQSLTSVEEIRKLLPMEVMETLTAEDDSVIENALARATATIYATLLGCGVESLTEEGKQVVKTALEKLTLYEISLYATVELPFQTHKEEALKLLETYFGCSKTKPAVVVRKDKRLKGLRIWELS
jgi:hypothetical protein